MTDTSVKVSGKNGSKRDGKLSNNETESSVDCSTSDDSLPFDEELDGLNEDDKKELNNIISDYYDEMGYYAYFPDDLTVKKFEAEHIKFSSVRANRKKRKEFNNQKEKLREEWSKKHNQAWPTYTEDLYSKSGKLIRRKGQPYDMHHIQPLSLGGDNTCDNMTPFHAKDHYDKQGIHANGGAYDRLSKKVKGLNSNKNG